MNKSQTLKMIDKLINQLTHDKRTLEYAIQIGSQLGCAPLGVYFNGAYSNLEQCKLILEVTERLLDASIEYCNSVSNE